MKTLEPSFDSLINRDAILDIFKILKTFTV